jgi:hypothetical protein
LHRGEFYLLSYASDEAGLNLYFYDLESFAPIPLTDAGGSVSGGASVYDFPNFTSWNVSASVVASSAPEPMSAGLMLLGSFTLLVFYRAAVRKTRRPVPTGNGSPQ